jgi:hypothetical protein
MLGLLTDYSPCSQKKLIAQMTVRVQKIYGQRSCQFTITGQRGETSNEEKNWNIADAILRGKERTEQMKIGRHGMALCAFADVELV